MVKQKKHKSRGGYRPAHKLTYGPSILLESIWKMHGGVAALGKKFGINSQAFTDWKRRGKVPLKKVGVISRELRISKWGLNYPELKLLEGKSPVWKDVVLSYKLDKVDEAKVLAGLEPKLEEF